MFLYDEPSTDCFECSAKDNLVCDVRYWFRSVLDQMYGIEKFNAESLEHYLDEMCGYLDMKIPQRDLYVQEKLKSAADNFLNVLDVFLTETNKTHFQNLKAGN